MRSLKTAQTILRSALMEAEKRHSRSIRRIQVEMEDTDCEACRTLTWCLQALAVGTIAEGARMEIKRVGPRAKCTRCGYTFRAKGVRLLCPACGDRWVQLLDREAQPTFIVSVS